MEATVSIIGKVVRVGPHQSRPELVKLGIEFDGSVSQFVVDEDTANLFAYGDRVLVTLTPLDEEE